MWNKPTSLCPDQPQHISAQKGRSDTLGEKLLEIGVIVSIPTFKMVCHYSSPHNARPVTGILKATSGEQTLPSVAVIN